MKELRKLSATTVLALMLTVSALAGETPPPPCGVTDPGQTSTPPCSAAAGDTNTSGVASTTLGDTTLVNDDISFTEIATDVVLNILSLY